MRTNDLKRWIVAVVSLLVLCGGVVAEEAERQEESRPGGRASQMGFSQLVAEAEVAMEGQRFHQAVDLLKEIISRASALDDRDAQGAVQTARLQLGLAQVELQQMAEARTQIEKYLKGDPVRNEIAAYQILCRIALSEQNWQELYEAARKLVDNRSIGLRDRERAEQFLVQALFYLERYEDALQMLPGVIQRSTDPEAIQAYRVMQIQCLNEVGRAEEIVTQLPVLFTSDARDDVTLNLTLLRIGDDLFDRQEYRKALAVYRLVVSRDDLIAGQEARIEARIAQGRAEDEWRIDELRQALEQLREIPDYDIHISFRAAQIYTEHHRYWEAIALFEQIYQGSPDSEEGKAALLQKILLLFEIEMVDEAIALSVDYLERVDSGFYVRVICTRLMQHYVETEQYDEALGLLRYMDSWPPPADEDERLQETDLRYMISFVYFQQGNYAEASHAFDRVIEIAPEGSIAGIDARYWKAMCELLRQDYVIAYSLFQDYRQRWPDATFASAALFRAGVCRFGMEQYDQAKEIFRDFIELYPNDSLTPEAIALYADLLGAEGELEEAVAQYWRAMRLLEELFSRETNPVFRSQLVSPATYALVQAARTLELDAEAYRDERQPERATERIRGIIEIATYYLEAFGEEADIAQAVYWIGQAQIDLGNPQQAVDAYLDAVVQFGGELAQEGVASILFDLVDLIQNRLDEQAQTRTIQAIRSAREVAEEPALQIRLDVLMAELDGRQMELGRELLDAYPDLGPVPPAGLSLMVSVLLADGDLSRSGEFFDHFERHYDGSVFMKKAYRLRAEDLFNQGRYDEAYDLVVAAIGRYGADPELAWAQLKKGNIELKKGLHVQAEESFTLVFSFGAWRGAPAAEATFRLGEVWEWRGNDERAFAFYQRTYLLYKAPAGGHWAAEGYLRSAETLRRMGRHEDALNTYRAMLRDEYVRDLPQAQTAKDALGPEETAALLSGEAGDGSEVSP